MLISFSKRICPIKLDPYIVLLTLINKYTSILSVSGLLNLRAHRVIHAFASGVIIANSININLKHKNILLSLFKADLISSDLAGAIPLTVFGVAAFIGGLLSFTLPETAYKKLPDSIEEADNFSRYA